MKKTILGSALMICGMIAGCTEYLVQTIVAIAFKLEHVDANVLLSLGGPILFFVGLVLCVIGLVKNQNAT